MARPTRTKKAESSAHDSPPKKKAPRWVGAFLAALRETANVRSACERAKVDRRHAYRYRAADHDFATAWYHALDEAADLLEEEARRRAYEGVHRLKFDRGRMIEIPMLDATGQPLMRDGQPIMVPYVEHEYSDTLLIFLLKGARPEVYRERAEIRHSGSINLGELSDDELRAIVEGTSSGRAGAAPPASVDPRPPDGD